MLVNIHFQREVYLKMHKFLMFVTAVCVLFLIKLRWPRNKRLYDTFIRIRLTKKKKKKRKKKKKGKEKKTSRKPRDQQPQQNLRLKQNLPRFCRTSKGYQKLLLVFTFTL